MKGVYGFYVEHSTYRDEQEAQRLQYRRPLIGKLASSKDYDDGGPYPAQAC